VADFQGARRIIETAVDSFGRLDILVNNAGIFREGLLDAQTEDDFDSIVAVHLKGTFNTCKHAVPVMRDQGGGRIINTASNQWTAPNGRVAYAAAKGGVVSLTWDLAWELRNQGITVNAIAPFAATRAAGGLEERYRQLTDAGLMTERRLHALEAREDPAYVAPLVVYLASEQAGDIHGRVFRVGGGKIGLYCHPVEVRQLWRDHLKDGPWPVEQLAELLPASLLAGEHLAPHLL